MRTLRFLNILEPGIAVISVSKLIVWVTFIATVVVLIFMPDKLPAVLAASGSFLTAAGNYGIRRYVSYKRETKETVKVQRR